MELIIIAAMTPQQVIGINGQIPWSIPSEQQFFKRVTMGHTLIMGRITWQSLNNPLPGRNKIIVTSHDLPEANNLQCARSLKQALQICAHEQKVFIAGGAQLYAAALPMAETLLITIVHQNFTGDTYFPAIPIENFELVGHACWPARIPYTIYQYKRV